MFRIGEFSKLAKTTVKTLRFYDEIGLFQPSFVDDNGYRYYSIEKLNELQRILTLRGFDVPIDDIKRLLSGCSVIEVLAARKAEIENELEKSKTDLELINKLMASAEKGEFMQKYQAKEIVIPEYNVYCRHGVIDTMENFVDFILGAGDEVRKNNPTLECEDYCFVTYTAKEYTEKNIELEYIEAVKSIGVESENIKFKHLPSTRAISIEHKGSYQNLRAAYAYGLNYVKENELEISEQLREVYIHGCWDTDSEDDYFTVIQIPVK